MMKSRQCLWVRAYENTAGYAYSVLVDVYGDALVSGCIQAGFTPLAIETRHVLAVGGLKRKDGEPPHNDPFDRILIAQAKTEEMTMITHDSLLDGYGEKCVLTI